MFLALAKSSLACMDSSYGEGRSLIYSLLENVNLSETVKSYLKRKEIYSIVISKYKSYISKDILLFERSLLLF